MGVVVEMCCLVCQERVERGELMGVDAEMLVEFYKGRRAVTTLGSYGTAYKKIV